MKKISIALMILLASSCKQKNPEDKYDKFPCTITSVRYYGAGQLNTLQIDPIWEVTTKYGVYKLRYPKEVGDTVWMYYPKDENR